MALFGDKFKAQWQGDADKAGWKDKIGILGLGISQLSAGQAPNIMPAWEAVEARRSKRKLNEAMSNPEFVSGFTPQQQAMLSAMPPEMAQSLIMEKMFAPPVKADWQQFGGDLYNMNDIDPATGKPRMTFDGMGEGEIEAQQRAADRELRKQDGLMLGYAEGSPEMSEYVVTGKPVERPKGPEWRTATPEEAAANGAVAGQINSVTGKFDAQNPPSSMTMTTNPDGTMTFEQGSGVKAKPYTEAQSKDIGFATRAEPAVENIDKYGDALTGWSGRGNAMAGVLPLGLTKGLQSDEYQLGKQAAGELATTMLRKDSGAAVPDSEYVAFDANYIPQPGDGDAVLEQKRMARRRMVEGLKAGMSPQAVMAQMGAISTADGTTGDLDFATMTAADLAQVDVGSLTEAQMAAMLKRFDEVNK